MKKLLLAVMVLAVTHLTCHQALLVAPPQSSITLVANPEFIPAHGGISVIAAIVTEPAGTPVADGTVVQFFTSLGRIDPQARTNDGVARVNLQADGRSGPAQITAVSGGQAAAPAPAPSGSPGTTPPSSGGGSNTATRTVNIGTALPARIQMTVFPPRILESRSAQVFAYVYDANGNPVANVPLLFNVESGSTVGATPSGSPSGSPPVTTPSGSPALTEFMESQGRPVFTDNNGVAQDVLRTRYPRESAAKIVSVRARTPNDRNETVQVIIN